MKDHDEPPATIKEVGIHIGYMRDDIAELKELVKKMPSAFATKVEMSDLHTDLTDKINFVDGKVNALDRKRWQQNTMSAIAGIVLAGLVAIALDKLIF